MPLRRLLSGSSAQFPLARRASSAFWYQLRTAPYLGGLHSPNKSCLLGQEAFGLCPESASRWFLRPKLNTTQRLLNIISLQVNELPAQLAKTETGTK